MVGSSISTFPSLPSVSVLVREELIDRLLIQELACDDAFARWFVPRCTGGEAGEGKIVELNQSRTRRGRETDVEVHWRRSDGQRLLILIENKIEAAFQPQQLEDYHARGQGLVRENKIDKYCVALLAPSKYLSSSLHTTKADVRVPYEDLLLYFAQHAGLDIRHAYAARIFEQAIGKGSRVYRGVADLAVTDFWSQYLVRFSRALPGWAPKKAKGADGSRPENSDIVYLYPPDKSLRGLGIAHKLKRRELELSFAGIGNLSDEFEQYLGSRVRPPASLEWSGATRAVRRTVPRVSPWDPFAGQLLEVDVAIGAADELVKWFMPHAEWWRAFRKRASSMK